MEFLIWEAAKSGVLPSRISWGATLRVVGLGVYFLTIVIVLCRFNSSRAVGQGMKSDRIVVNFGHPYLGKPTKLLNEREFYDRFCFPNCISV